MKDLVPPCPCGAKISARELRGNDGLCDNCYLRLLAAVARKRRR